MHATGFQKRIVNICPYTYTGTFCLKYKTHVFLFRGHCLYFEWYLLSGIPGRAGGIASAFCSIYNLTRLLETSYHHATSLGVLRPFVEKFRVCAIKSEESRRILEKINSKCWYMKINVCAFSSSFLVTKRKWLHVQARLRFWQCSSTHIMPLKAECKIVILWMKDTRVRSWRLNRFLVVV